MDETQEVAKSLAKGFQALGQQPESLFALLERLEIPWSKTDLPLSTAGSDDEPISTACVIIKWEDLMSGEKRNQEQGPMLKRLYSDAELKKMLDFAAQNRSATTQSTVLDSSRLVVPTNMKGIQL